VRPTDRSARRNENIIIVPPSPRECPSLPDSVPRVRIIFYKRIKEKERRNTTKKKNITWWAVYRFYCPPDIFELPRDCTACVRTRNVRCTFDIINTCGTNDVDVSLYAYTPCSADRASAAARTRPRVRNRPRKLSGEHWKNEAKSNCSVYLNLRSITSVLKNVRFYYTRGWSGYNYV
jgi:hypothetical protein